MMQQWQAVWKKIANRLCSLLQLFIARQKSTLDCWQALKGLLMVQYLLSPSTRPILASRILEWAGTFSFACIWLLFIWPVNSKGNLQICCHQKASFKAKMHQIRFRLGFRHRPRWGSLQHSTGCTDKRPPDIRPPDKRPLKMLTPD